MTRYKYARLFAILLHLAHRLPGSPKPCQCNPFGVESLCNGASRFESGLLVHVRRHRLSVAESLVCKSRSHGVIARAKREVAALL